MRQTYFLGGVSAGGFQSRFSERLQSAGMYAFLLKGGPGTGKSTLMRRIAEAFPDEDVSLYHCASDASSLDAVVLENRGVLIADATAPHVMEVAQPMLTGEIVNLGACLDGEKLRARRAELAELFAENARLHKRVRQYAQAVTSLHDDLRAAGNQALLHEKLTAFCGRLARRLLPKATGAVGQMTHSQLSALTAEGYVTRPLPDDWYIVTLHDPYFAGSDLLLRCFASAACARGLDCIMSENYLLGESGCEHLLVPACRLALVTESTCTAPDVVAAQVLQFRRFYEKSALSRRRQRLSFDQKASRSLLEEAAGSLAEALRVHDALEADYIDAMDFARADAAAAAILSEIRRAHPAADSAD